MHSFAMALLFLLVSDVCLCTNRMIRVILPAINKYSLGASVVGSFNHPTQKQQQRLLTLESKSGLRSGIGSKQGAMTVASMQKSLEEDDSDSTIGQHLFSVAPMMEYTDRHQRRLQRLLTRRAVLYTEMVTTNALVRSEDMLRFLRADFEAESPLVLQLGGSDPQQMLKAARAAYAYGYREINLNVGCPSEKVAGAGCFGAALMLNPPLVVALCTSIAEATGRPATVKCRIGVDDQDSYPHLAAFVQSVSEGAGVRHFIVHARKAVLNANFSPHDNRTIPPLRYDVVRSLVRDFPHLHFTLNGGVGSLEEAIALLRAHDWGKEEHAARDDSANRPHCAGSVEHEDIHSNGDGFSNRYEHSGSSSSSSSGGCHGGTGFTRDGGISSTAVPLLAGVMVGRAVVNAPFNWSQVDSAIYGDIDPGKRYSTLVLVSVFVCLGVNLTTFFTRTRQNSLVKLGLLVVCCCIGCCHSLIQWSFLSS